MSPPRKDHDSDGLDLNPRYMHRRLNAIETQVTEIDDRVETLEDNEVRRQAISMWKSGVASFIGSMLAAAVAAIGIWSYLSGLRK